MPKKIYTEADITLRLRNYVKIRTDLIEQFVTEEMKEFVLLKNKRKNKQYFKIG